MTLVNHPLSFISWFWIIFLDLYLIMWFPTLSNAISVAFLWSTINTITHISKRYSYLLRFLSNHKAEDHGSQQMPFCLPLTSHENSFIFYCILIPDKPKESIFIQFCENRLFTLSILPPWRKVRRFLRIPTNSYESF